MTEASKKAYHDKVDENIKNHGYHMTFVFGGDSPTFCYSTGISKNLGIPEIFISSLPENLSFTLIKSYVERFAKTKEIPIDTKIDDLSDRFPIYLIKVPNDNLNDYALSTIMRYDKCDYEYVQLIYPDTEGNFPNDTGYDYDQEIMAQFKS